MTINANSHPYKVIVGDGNSPIYANRHPIKVDVEGGVVTPAEFEELEKKVDALATDLSYKGGVPTYDDLPADAETGDVYTTEDTGILYVWDGTEWVALNDTGSSVMTGSSDPTTSTEGELGQLYINTTTDKLFYCAGETSGSYTWIGIGGEGVKELTSADFNGAGVVNTAQLTPGKYVLSPSIKSTYADGTPWLKIGNFDASSTEIVFGRQNSGDMGSYDMTSRVWRPFMVVDSFEINDADRVIIVNAHCLTTHISAATLLNYGIFDEMTYIFPFEDLYDPGWGDDYKYYRLKMPSVYNDSFSNLEAAFTYYRDNRFYDYLTLTPFAVVKKSDPVLSVFNAQHPGLVPKAPTSGRENHILYGNGVWGGWTQADYDQNDSTAKAYIQNRPFYESTSTQTTAVAAASQAFSESVEYRSWCLALNELLYTKGVINDQYNLFPYLTTSNTLPAALATALTNEDTLCLMKSQNNENFYAQWTDMGSMSDEYVYIKPVAFPAWGAAESVSGGGYTFSIQLTQAAVEYSWDNASWSPGIVVLAKLYDPEYSQDVFCMGIFTGGGSILPSGQSVMANGGRVGTYTAITTIHQLDAKYVPIDNSTITVNGSGKLVASGGPTVVQTTGTSTTDVMSQVATTQLIYPSGHETAKDRVAIAGASVYGDQSIGIGGGASVPSGATGCVAIGGKYNNGPSAYAVQGGAIAIGSRNTFARKGDSIAIGRLADINADHGVGIGLDTSATGDNTVALGAYSRATVKGQFDISCYGTNHGYNNSAYRLLTGLYDPQSDHDAANKQYVDSKAATLLTNSEFNQILTEA